MKKNRLIALLTVLVMVAALLSACGTPSDQGNNGASPSSSPSDTPNSSPSSAEPSGEPAAAAEPVTIWYYWETEGHQVALDKVIQDYNASQDKYEVTAKYVPFADSCPSVHPPTSCPTSPSWTRRTTPPTPPWASSRTLPASLT